MSLTAACCAEVGVNSSSSSPAPTRSLYCVVNCISSLSYSHLFLLFFLSVFFPLVLSWEEPQNHECCGLVSSSSSSLLVPSCSLFISLLPSCTGTKSYSFCHCALHQSFCQPGQTVGQHAHAVLGFATCACCIAICVIRWHICGFRHFLHDISDECYAVNPRWTQWRRGRL